MAKKQLQFYKVLGIGTEEESRRLFETV